MAEKAYTPIIEKPVKLKDTLKTVIFVNSLIQSPWNNAETPSNVKCSLKIYSLQLHCVNKIHPICNMYKLVYATNTYNNHETYFITLH